MATAKSSPTTEIGEIQRKMARVRHDLHEDVREAVKGAQSLTDWRSVVRSHPWLALATASLTGYLIVPRRRSEGPAVVAVSVPPTGPPALAPAHHLDLSSVGAPRKKRVWGLVGSVLGLLAPVAIRAAQNYAAQYLEQRLTPQSAAGVGDRFETPESPGSRSSRDHR